MMLASEMPVATIAGALLLGLHTDRIEPVEVAQGLNSARQEFVREGSSFQG